MKTNRKIRCVPKVPRKIQLYIDGVDKGDIRDIGDIEHTEDIGHKGAIGGIRNVNRTLAHTSGT